jgi:hypothetical protein
MKKWLTILVAAGLLLYPLAANAADYGSPPPQTQQVPPVAQPLVREGDFAVKLAAELGLGNPSDEAVAQDMLAKAGVVPLNGWIPDYPMTPVIVGQLQDAIEQASAQGTLPMSSSEATEALTILAAEMNLPTPAGDGTSAPQGSPSPPVPQDPTVINNYYYDAGPPIVTYYPPPPYYAYLYAWVPYPTFWFGFWYPGFYICNDFTTVVVVKSVDHYHREHWKQGTVSNHFFDPVTKRHAVVDPIIKTRDGKHRPTTMLRARNGEQFNNLAEMRREVNRTGFRNRGPGSFTNGADIRGFRSPEARKSAEAIYSRSLENMRKQGVREGSRNPGSDRQYMPSNRVREGNSSERQYTVPNRVRDGSIGERHYGPPSRTREQTVNLGGGRGYRTPNASPGLSNAPSGYGERRSYTPERMYRSSAMAPATRQGEQIRNVTRENVPSYRSGQHTIQTNPSARAYSGNGQFNNSNGFGRYGSR